MNYTKEQSEYMVRKYSESPTAETVAGLVEELGKSKKSIIGKLSREGVYRRESYKSKTGEEPVTKLQLVNEIAERLSLEVDELLGLEKTPKNVLKRIVDRLE
jgi:hypothetical protein